MIKEFTLPPSEYGPITKLCFGSIVTLKGNPQKHYLILDAKGIDNVHGSLIEKDEGGSFITSGGGGTMSVSDFEFFVKQLDFEQAIKFIEWGWRRRFKQPLPDNLRTFFKIESQSQALVVNTS